MHAGSGLSLGHPQKVAVCLKHPIVQPQQQTRGLAEIDDGLDLQDVVNS